jgi:hypothetical protein
MDWNFPDAHAVHTVPPAAAEKVPEEQGLHVKSPLAEVIVPVLQVVHPGPLATPVVPGWQDTHCVLSPLLVFPAAQVTHTACPWPE